VRAEAPTGRVVDLSELLDEQRVISAEVIRCLCVGPEAKSVDPRGISIRGAHVVDRLDLSYCEVPHPLSFSATTFEFAPDLRWAQLPGLAIRDGCSLPGLQAEGLRLDHDLQLIACKVDGIVKLLGARIGGQLNCVDAILTNEGGSALDADSAEINGHVFFRGGFRATGTVRLLGAKTGGQLACERATLSNEGGLALDADSSEINGSTFLRDGFNATGTVRLLAAKIGGQLNCEGATLTNEGGDALDAERAEIDGHVLLRNGFRATGTVRLVGAKIGGGLALADATLARAGDALDARDAVIGSAIRFANVRVTGGIDLFRASATTLEDDLGSGESRLGSWSLVQRLVLDGFTYARFGHDAEWGARLRAKWLKSTTGFQQGAWQQLISVYRAQGRDEDATTAAIAMHKDRIKRARLPRYRRWGRLVLGATVGHGYRPWLAGIWAVLVIAAFALFVWHWSGMFVPAKQDVTGPQPIGYAADVFLPIVDLGQADDWQPTGWVRWVNWGVILLGWALTTIFVAGFTRIVRSE